MSPMNSMGLPPIWSCLFWKPYSTNL